MIKVENAAAFSEKTVIAANQCVTPTNCNCRKCMESATDVQAEVQQAYSKKN